MVSHQTVIAQEQRHQTHHTESLVDGICGVTSPYISYFWCIIKAVVPFSQGVFLPLCEMENIEWPHQPVEPHHKLFPGPSQAPLLFQINYLCILVISCIARNCTGWLTHRNSTSPGTPSQWVLVSLVHSHTRLLCRKHLQVTPEQDPLSYWWSRLSLPYLEVLFCWHPEAAVSPSCDTTGYCTTGTLMPVPVSPEPKDFGQDYSQPLQIYTCYLFLVSRHFTGSKNRTMKRELQSQIKEDTPCLGLKMASQ